MVNTHSKLQTILDFPIKLFRVKNIILTLIIISVFLIITLT